MSDYDNSGNEKSKFPKSDTFKKKIENLKQKMESVLKEFVGYYTAYSSNPDNEEYQHFFQNIHSNLENLNTELFLIQNDVEVHIDLLNKSMTQIDDDINKQKKLNKLYLSKLPTLENEYNGSSELIDDYTKMYNVLYLRNFALVIGIIISAFFISKFFTGQNGPNPNNPNNQNNSNRPNKRYPRN